MKRSKRSKKGRVHYENVENVKVNVTVIRETKNSRCCPSG